MIDIGDLLKNDAFKNLDQEQADLFRELLTKVSGKSGMEAMPILMEYSKKASKYKQYNKDEQNAMLDAFCSVLPDEEKSSFQNVIKMLKMMSK